MSMYWIVALPILPLTSAIAILMALAMVSVWPLFAPVRGRLETILIVPLSCAPPAATGLGDAAAPGDGDGEAAGDAAGLAAGLAAGEAAGDAPGEAAVAGEAAGDAAAGFGAVVGCAAGAAVGWAPPPPHAVTNNMPATDSEDKRA